MIGNVKHYAVNNQEGAAPSAPGAPLGAGAVGNRLTVDARVDERTLREIYLPHFEAAVKEANVGSVMCSYNRINGPYACENPRMLEEILRREWGFKGYVLADYGAAKDTRESLQRRAGLRPWPGIAYSPALVNAALAARRARVGARRARGPRSCARCSPTGSSTAPPTRTTGARSTEGHARARSGSTSAGIMLLKNERRRAAARRAARCSRWR